MGYKDPEQRRQYQAAWLSARRAEFFRDKHCVRCGSEDQLELDHIDRAQKVTHRIWSWSEERRSEELAKCQILCSECHREKTDGELTKQLVHGTLHAYIRRKCRCEPCRDAAAAYQRERRRRIAQR